MTAAEILARTTDTVQCRLPGCVALLPVKVSCNPVGEDVYDVLVTPDPEALRQHLRDAHRPAPRPALRQVR